jgi:hypothetical protein
MDAFESIVAALLQRQGYWTQTSFKVELTKEEKRAVGRHSAPRWELDVVAYKGATNELRVVECKSYLDSQGVDCAAFDGSNARARERYKLFCDATLREVVLQRLKRQLHSSGFCANNPSLVLCLAAGRIKGSESWLRQHFAANGWLLWGPSEIRDHLASLRDAGYENSVAAVVSKLLLRELPARSRLEQPR